MAAISNRECFRIPSGDQIFSEAAMSFVFLAYMVFGIKIFYACINFVLKATKQTFHSILRTTRNMINRRLSKKTSPVSAILKVTNATPGWFKAKGSGITNQAQMWAQKLGGELCKFAFHTLNKVAMFLQDVNGVAMVMLAGIASFVYNPHEAACWWLFKMAIVLQGTASRISETTELVLVTARSAKIVQKSLPSTKKLTRIPYTRYLAALDDRAIAQAEQLLIETSPHFRRLDAHARAGMIDQIVQDIRKYVEKPGHVTSPVGAYLIAGQVVTYQHEKDWFEVYSITKAPSPASSSAQTEVSLFAVFLMQVYILVTGSGNLGMAEVVPTPFYDDVLPAPIVSATANSQPRTPDQRKTGLDREFELRTPEQNNDDSGYWSQRVTPSNGSDKD